MRESVLDLLLDLVDHRIDVGGEKLRVFRCDHRGVPEVKYAIDGLAFVFDDQGDEQYDGIASNNVKVLVVNHHRKLAAVIFWELHKTLDDIPQISRGY